LTYFWVPLGFIITGIQYIMTVVKNLQSDDIYISYEQIDTYDEGEGIESPSQLAAETAADRAN
jgi:hypothetical protein